MVALGLILVLIAVVVVVYVWFATAGLPAMEIDWGIFTAELTPFQLFGVGAGTVLLLSLGAVVLSAGLKRQRAKRSEIKRLRKEVATSEPADAHTSPDSGSRTPSGTATSSRRAEPATQDGTTSSRQHRPSTQETAPLSRPAGSAPAPRSGDQSADTRGTGTRDPGTGPSDGDRDGLQDRPGQAPPPPGT